VETRNIVLVETEI